MAQIVLSGDELVGVLYANELIPSQITEVQTDGDEIKLKVRTQWPVLRSVRVGVRLAGFEDGQLVLQLVTNRLLDTFDWLVDKMLESFELAEHGGRWEYPRLYIDLNRLVADQVRGVIVHDVAFVDGYFRITTTHPPQPSDTQDPDETASDTSSDTSCMQAL